VKFRIPVAVLAIAAIVMSLWHLRHSEDGTLRSIRDVEGVPVTVFTPSSGARGPTVLIAHGFAGSGRLMESFALSFARAGYTAVTFDLPGHGRNPRALTGSITEIDGATRTLLTALGHVADDVKTIGDGRLAVLGHSMSSDVVVRLAESRADIAATIAVSMFAPTVSAVAPRNLLVIVGDLEGPLKREALRAIGLATSPEPAQPFITYGDFATGSARRVAFSAHVEHASVLYSEDSQREAVAWLDQTFAVERPATVVQGGRGPWILLLLAAVVALAWPLAALLPRVAPKASGASLRWSRLWPAFVVPMVATPLVLRVVPTHFLPVLVGDYLAVHFATYGAVTALCLAWLRRQGTPRGRAPTSWGRLGLASAIVTAYGFVGLVLPLDRYVTSFVPTPARVPLVLAMLVGTLGFFLADEWTTRGAGAARGAYAVSKLAFLASLAIAVGLDFERLFFLIIIVPVIVLFFVVHGAFSAWSYRRTGHPFVAAIANAIAFAWAIGVTFPMLAG
jgi:pimeloyl-ACP methyl ester carboxylesterase